MPDSPDRALPSRKQDPISLRRRVLSATRWTTASFLAGFASQFLQYVVLGRTLEPHQLGLISIITTLTGFADLFVGIGITQAIVQRRRVTSRELSSLYWLNIGMGLIVGAAVYSSSGPVADFYGAPEAAPLIRLASVIFVITAVGQVARSVLEKRLLFREIAVAEVTGAVIVFVVSTGLALSGLGAASAIVGLICAAIARNVVLRVVARRYFRPRRRLRLRETGRFLTFGTLQSIDSVVNFVASNLSTIATGRFVGTAAMGGYTLAYNTGVNTPAKINPIITRIMFPVFAQMQHDPARMSAGYVSVTSAVGFASIPGLLGVALVSEDVMVGLYGPQWAGFGPVLAVLCVVGMFRALGNPVGFVLMATDRVGLGLAVNLAKTAFTVPAIIIGARTGGAFGAATGVLLSQLLGLVLAAWLLRRVIHLGYRRYLRACLTPVLLSLPMAAAIVVTQRLVDGRVGLWPSLIITGVAGLAVLGGTVLLSRDPTVLEIRSLLPRVRRRGAPPAVAVILPVEERFDGTGGAVAHWVREVYSRCPVDHAVFAASIGVEYGSATSTAPLRDYRLYERVSSALAVPIAVLARKPHRSVHLHLLFGGRPYLRAVAPHLAGVRVVHLHNRPQYAELLRAHGYRGRIVLHMHNDLADYVPADRRERLTEVVDAFVFCSDFLRRKAEREFGLSSATTLYNGVDPVAETAGARRPGELVFAGRVVAEKGVLEAVEAVVSLRRRGRAEYRLRIFGGPGSGSQSPPTPYFDRVVAAARAADAEFGAGTVTIEGHLRHGELLARVSGAHAFVYPCAWDEPFGLVIVEALAVGTPVVAFRKGGIPEIVEHGRSGLLVDPSAGLGGIERAIEALEDDDVWSAQSAAARERARSAFGWDAIAAQTFEVLT